MSLTVQKKEVGEEKAATSSSSASFITYPARSGSWSLLSRGLLGQAEERQGLR
jgi:hypothetical protein